MYKVPNNKVPNHKIPVLYCLYCPRRCLQQVVLHLDVSVQQKPVLYPEDGLQQLVVHLDCLSTRASAAPRRVCLQELMCAPEVSVKYIEPVLHLCVSVCLQELLCAPEVSVDYIEPVLYLFLSVYNLCSTWKCLSSRACAAFVHFCLPELCSASVLV